MSARSTTPDFIEEIGGIARWLGLERIAALLPEGREYQPPTAPELDPAEGLYAFEAMQALREAPYHPDLIAQLYAHGFADACPATMALLAKRAIEASLWPPSYDPYLRADLLNHARYAEPMLAAARGDPDIRYQREMLALNRRYFEEEVFLGGAELADPILKTKTAKRRFFDREQHGPGEQLDRLRLQWWDTVVTELPDWETNVHRWADPDRPETPPTQDMVVSAMRFGNMALLADLRPLGTVVFRTLATLTRNSELGWLLVETALEQGDVETAVRYFEECGEPPGNDIPGWDNYRCASARIASVQGDMTQMAAVLAEIERDLLADPAAATDINPRSAVMVIERRMRQGEQPSGIDMTIGMRALLANPAWPAANRMMATMFLASRLSQGRLEGTFEPLDEMGARLPGEVSIWRIAARNVARWPVGSGGFIAALGRQIGRTPLIKGYWSLLAETCEHSGLAQAIRDDLTERALASAPRRRSRARLAAAAAATQHRAALDRTGPPIPRTLPKTAEPPLPDSVFDLLEKTRLDTTDPGLVLAALQPAPAAGSVVQRLLAMGFFEAMPVVGALAAYDLMQQRHWEGELADALAPRAERGRQLLDGSLAPLALLESELATDSDRFGPWAEAAIAKRRALGDGSATEDLLAAVERTGDPEAALLYAGRHPEPVDGEPVHDFLLNLRAGGLLSAVSVLGEHLLRARQGVDLAYFVIDALLEVGDRVGAERVLDLQRSSCREDEWGDMPRAAAARVALATGQRDEARRLLARVEKDLENGSLAVSVDEQRHSLLVLAAVLPAGEIAASAHVTQAVYACQQAAADFPFARSVLARTLAAQGLDHPSPRALYGMRPSLRDMPGELGVFESVGELVADTPLADLLLTTLEAHVSRYWHLERGWQALEREHGRRW